jgi:hypothetical protein
MAAGLGFKDFVTGEVLTAADVDGYLMQGVWVFASATARDAAVTSPQEGNFAYLKDTNVTTYYTGSAWANLDTTGMTNPMTTTGDTIYSSSGSTPARLGIGTAGQVLQVNSGATAPEWATPAGGGGMTLLSTTSMNTGTATVTVSSIDQTYKTLEIHIIDPTWATGNSQLLLTAQSSSSIQGAGSTMYNSGTNTIAVGYSGTSFAPTAQQTSNTSADLNCVWQIYNYTATTSFKSWGLYYGDASRGGVGGGVIATTTAISSIAITTTQSYNFNGGSILVYGIK